jgi:hypothetical protein
MTAMLVRIGLDTYVIHVGSDHSKKGAVSCFAAFCCYSTIQPGAVAACGVRPLLAHEPGIFFRRTIHMCLLQGLFHGLKVKPDTLAGGKERPGDVKGMEVSSGSTMQ